MATSGSKSVKVTTWDTLKFSWWENSQSIDNNKTTIGWKLELIAGSSGRIDSSVSKSWSVTVNGTTYSGKNNVGISNNATKTLASGTTTIGHNLDGTKTFSYSFSQQFSITFSGSSIGTISGSGSGTLDTIPRASSFGTITGNTLGSKITVNIIRNSTSFTHQVFFKVGNSSFINLGTGFGTSVSFVPEISLCSHFPNATSGTMQLRIITFNGSTQIGSAVDKSISVQLPSGVVKPSVSLSVTDETGYADIFGVYVQGRSKLKVEITASGGYGSTIKSYKTTADGKTYTSASFETSVISGNGTLTISTTVTDSRGITVTASKTITVLAYSLPQINSLNSFRCDAEGVANSSGEFLAIVFDSVITTLNNKNSATYQLKYKKTTDDEYTTETLTDFEGQYSVSGGVFVMSAEKSSSYNFTLIVADYFTETTKTVVGASIKKRFSILKEIFGFAIGKIAELPNVFDIALQTRFTGGILHPVLEPDTDLNDVMTPNIYVGANVATYNYVNCPLTSGTFTLEVIGMGEDGQVKQRLTYCHKTASRTWERIYYSSAWGDWICVSDFDGQLLWEGAFYMHGTQTINLSEAISIQAHGIVLVFSGYNIDDGVPYDLNFIYKFIPKYHIKAHEGAGICVSHVGTDFAMAKYLYISNKSISGHGYNDDVMTANGVNLSNNRFVLRYVIGV